MLWLSESERTTPVFTRCMTYDCTDSMFTSMPKKRFSPGRNGAPVTTFTP